MFYKKSFLVPIAFLFSSSLLAKEEKTLILLTTANYPPFTLPLDHKEGPGLDVEIAKIALERKGYKIELKEMKWERALQTLKDGDADLTTTASYRDDRNDFLDWSIPYRDTPTYHFYALAQTSFKVQKFEDLKGKTIGITKGYSIPNALNEMIAKKEIQTEEGLDVPKTFEKLIKGQGGDAIFVNYFVGGWEMKEAHLGSKLRKLELEYKSPTGKGTVFAFSKAKKLQEVILKMNEALEEMKKDGTMEKIEKKYLESTSSKKE